MFRRRSTAAPAHAPEAHTTGAVAPSASRSGQAGGGAGAPLLEPALLARLEAMQLVTRRRLAGALAGEHRSTRHGSSLDFADQREYHPGDDFRRIDYHVLARLDQLLIRLYEADDDLVVRLVVDTSASMAHGGKLRQAARLAGALGFISLTRRDIVSVHTYPLERPAPRFRGRNASSALFAHLAELTASGVTEFGAAVTHLLARPGPAGVTIVVSDMLTPDWSDGLLRVPSRGADLVLIHVLAADDLRPGMRGDLRGDLELVDSETGEEVLVSASEAVLDQYERLAGGWADDVARRCRGLGAAYVRVMADDDLERVLLQAWRHDGVLR